MKVEIGVCQVWWHFFSIALVRVSLDCVLFRVLKILGIDFRDFVDPCEFLIDLFNPPKLCASCNCSISENYIGGLFNADQVEKLFFLDALAVGIVNSAACFVDFSCPQTKKDLVVAEKVRAV